MIVTNKYHNLMLRLYNNFIRFFVFILNINLFSQRERTNVIEINIFLENWWIDQYILIHSIKRRKGVPPLLSLNYPHTYKDKYPKANTFLLQVTMSSFPFLSLPFLFLRKTRLEMILIKRNLKLSPVVFKILTNSTFHF